MALVDEEGFIHLMDTRKSAQESLIKGTCTVVSF